MSFGKDSVAEKKFHLNRVWFGVFVTGFLIFALLRGLKKRTRLLHVEGR